MTVTKQRNHKKTTVTKQQNHKKATVTKKRLLQKSQNGDCYKTGKLQNSQNTKNCGFVIVPVL